MDAQRFDIVKRIPIKKILDFLNMNPIEKENKYVCADGTIVYKDKNYYWRSAEDKGDVITLVAKERGISMTDAVEELERQFPDDIHEIEAKMNQPANGVNTSMNKQTPPSGQAQTIIQPQPPTGSNNQSEPDPANMTKYYIVTMNKKLAGYIFLPKQLP